MGKEERRKIILKHLSEFPNMENLTLAKMIYKNSKLLFKDVEQVRSAIRIYKGANGKGHLKNLKNTKFLTSENRQKKYNLPEAIETDYKPYKIIGNKGLIFGDVHIPFHSIRAIETMFNYTINQNIDFIIINGDFTDCYDASRFDKDPTRDKLHIEREKAKIFLKELKRIYPKAKIYYKFGNHEKRMSDLLKIKAPEFFGFKEFRWDVLLDLFNLGIEYIPEDRYIDLSGLYIYHGHEFKNGITSPANPARTAFLRSKDCAVVAHHHQSSEHTEKSINDKIITCWSLGCLSELHPEYMPLNKWNHGFAIYEQEDDDFWHVKNKRIIGNRVV